MGYTAEQQRKVNGAWVKEPDIHSLGLPTTQKIIAAHGGRIGVQSEVGRGTQITIELPVPARLAGGGD